MSVLLTNNARAECAMNEKFSILHEAAACINLNTARLRLCLVYLTVNISMLRLLCLFVLLGLAS